MNSSVEFELPVKAFSVNKMSARDIRFKTSEYKEWATKVLALLQDMDEFKGLMEIADDFRAKGGEFEVFFTYMYPHHEFYTKNNIISSKTVDMSNGAKPLLDLIFGDTMDVNDKFVTKLTEAKCAGPRHSIKIIIRHFAP